MDWSELFYSFVNIINEMSPYILLGFLIGGILHVFVPERTLLRHLSGNGMGTVVKAAAVGIPLPLCSCGVLPTAVSLKRQGASNAATTSFLIATPQTGVDSIMATYSLLGPAFAITRPIAALVCAFFGGMAVGKFDDDKTSDTKAAINATIVQSSPFYKKIFGSVRYGFVDMIDSIGKWLVIGLVVATLITVFVPDSWFVGLRQYPLAAMLLVVLIAVPMYVCATGSIPIALSLMMKGLTPGVAFVLLMAGPAANFASLIILKRTMGKRTTVIYVASVTLTALLFGVIIDYLLPANWFIPESVSTTGTCHTEMGLFETLCSIFLIILILSSFVRVTLSGRNKHQHINTDMTQQFTVKGMNCQHCRANVENAVKGVDGVETVIVNLSDGKVTVEGNADAEKIREAIRNAGYDID